MALSEDSVRRIIREELDAAMADASGRLAYSYDEAARLVGYSDDVLRAAGKRGELRLSYANSKPIITTQALREWVAGLGDEPVRRPGVDR